MTDFKLMPKQITKEMADAFWEEYSKDRTDDLLSRCYRALYVAAPVEQAESVHSPRTEDTTSTDSNSEQEQFSVIDMPTAHPAITHCDNCGYDWLDNGLNPIGCPYCKQKEE